MLDSGWNLRSLALVRMAEGLYLSVYELRSRRSASRSGQDLLVPRPPLRLLRIANPIVRGVLGSPAHRLLSGALVVLEYRGSRSGRGYRIPLQYAETDGGRIVALAVRPERKLWWRSFAGPAPAAVLIAGEERVVTGRLLEGRERREALRAYLARFPRAAGPLGLSRDPTDDALDAAPAALVGLDPG
jgi:hypothetical protein